MLSIDGRKHQVTLVRFAPDQVRIKVGLARNLVGATEDLGHMANRLHAIAAINGTFFDAYSKAARRNPTNALISNGQIVYKSNIGSVFTVDSRGKPSIGRPQWRIEGRIVQGNRNRSWYAYWLNRLPTSDTTVTIFNRFWGLDTGLDGLQIVADQNGKVIRKALTSQPIPAGGFTVLFTGAEKRLGERISIGDVLTYKVVNTGEQKWSAGEGVGGGPRLLKDGVIALDPVSEEFTDPKILNGPGARSAVGIAANGDVILAVTQGTIKELAKIMLRLGCRDAMNLDGGASSGLWFQGRYLRKPGRPIGNALLVLPIGK